MKTLISATTRTEVFERLSHLGPDTPRRWGKMTAHQMICHLADAFRMGLGERAFTIRPTLMSRTLIKWVALHGPFRWPHGQPTAREANQVRGGGTAPIGFAQDLETVTELVRRFCDSTGAGAHPFFGDLTHWQWMRWGYLHTDHHLRQFGV